MTTAIESREAARFLRVWRKHQDEMAVDELLDDLGNGSSILEAAEDRGWTPCCGGTGEIQTSVPWDFRPCSECRGQ